MWIPPAHSPFTPRQALTALGAGRSAVAALERELAERFQADRVVLADSGTHALDLALRAALGAVRSERRAAALPAYSCFDLVTAALGAGAPTRFYDLDPLTLAPDPRSLRRAVEAGAGVVVAANLFGLPLDPGVLDELRSTEGVVLIEDAAQGLGAHVGGRAAGTLGDLTVLSFGRGKGWTGSGGGALLLRGRFAGTDLRDGLDRADFSRAGLAARALAQWSLARPSLYGLPARLPFLGLGETRFHAPTPVRAIHPYQAALVLASAEKARDEIAVRRAAAARLDAALRGVGGLALPSPVAGGEGAWLRLPLLLESLPPELPDEVRRLGVYRAYPRLLPELWATASGGPIDTVDHPGCRRIVRTLVTVPTHGRTPLKHLSRRLPPVLTRLAARPGSR